MVDQIPAVNHLEPCSQQQHSSNSLHLSSETGVRDDIHRTYLRDNATNLPNTSCLEYALCQNKTQGCLLMLDIISLKEFSGIYGPDSGDALLCLIRDFILGLNIPYSALYRVNTGDFALIIAGTAHDADLPMRVAKQIQARLAKEWSLPDGGYPQNVIISGRICVMPLEQDKYASFAELQKAASYTLDMAQNSGGVALYGGEIEQNYQRRQALATRLKHSVHAGMAGFQLQYQPLIESAPAKWGGIEAFCSWDSGDFGVIGPSEVIASAESCGLLDKISLWMLEQAIVQVKHWRLEQVEGFLLLVNLFPTQFTARNFEQLITGLLQKHDYPHEKLCLAVREADSANFSEHTINSFNRLCASGVLLALDNCGGPSSLGLWQKLPLKLLKINAALPADTAAHRQEQHIMNAMAGLAHNMGIKIIASGVMTAEQAQAPLCHGADYMQGGCFSPPLTKWKLGRQLHNFYAPADHLVSLGFGKMDIPPAPSHMLQPQTMEKRYTQQEIVLNSLDIAIHVTDLETGQILFANSGLARLYGNLPFTGRKCWEVLENRAEPCPYCQKNELLQSPGKIRQWDHYCEPLEKHLRIWGSIIPWTDQKLVYLEYAEDITELKTSQEKLEFMASVDMLTLVLNRPAFMEALKKILDYAIENNTPVTLAFIDINGLKQVNDTLGHAAGDELICRVASALKNNIRESDALGRFGGDEFVIAFSHCIKEYADRRIHHVLAALGDNKGGHGQKYSFSYGLAENNEISCLHTEEYAERLMELADARMFVQKKAHQAK